MKKGYVIALITTGICLTISALLGGGEILIVLMMFGALSLVASFFCLVIGLGSGNPETKKGFLLTAGILLLLGAGICGPMLMSV